MNDTTENTTRDNSSDDHEGGRRGPPAHFVKVCYNQRRAQARADDRPDAGPLFSSSRGHLEELLEKTAEAESGERVRALRAGGVREMRFSFAGDPEGAEAAAEEMRALAADMFDLQRPHFQAVVIAGRPTHK